MMPSKRKKDGPQGLGDKEYLSLELDGYVRGLIGATGSEDVSALVDKAITTLAWVVENQKKGRRVFATTEDISERPETQELVVDVTKDEGT